MQNQSSNLKKYQTQNPVKKFLIENFKETFLHVLESETFLRNGSATGQVLDLGCGEGFIIDLLSKKYTQLKIEGIDFSEEALKITREKHPNVKLYLNSVLELPEDIYTKEYDLLIMTEVLEHITDYQTVLDNLKRIHFKTLVLSVPNEPLFSLSNLVFGKNIKRFGKDPEHVNYWNAESLRKLLEQNFRVIKIVKPYPWLMAVCTKK